MSKIFLQKRYAGGFAVFKLGEDGQIERYLDPAVLPDKFDRVDLTHILKNYGELFGLVVYEIYMKFPEIKGYRFDTKFSMQSRIGMGTNVPVPVSKGGITPDGYFLMDFKRK